MNEPITDEPRTYIFSCVSCKQRGPYNYYPDLFCEGDSKCNWRCATCLVAYLKCTLCSAKCEPEQLIWVTAHRNICRNCVIKNKKLLELVATNPEPATFAIRLLGAADPDMFKFGVEGPSDWKK